MPSKPGTISEARSVLRKVRAGTKVGNAALRRAVLCLGNLADRQGMELRAIKQAQQTVRPPAAYPY